MDFTMSNSMLPGPVSNNRRRLLSDEDWEGQRQPFQQLYFTENRTLREVIEIMEKEYGFSATEKQYKTRIKRWGLEKNVKTKEMKAIIRMKRKRKDVDGKESEFVVRSRVVPPRKIQRYMTRAEPEFSRSFLQPSLIESTTSDIFYYTPPGGGPPIPGVISSPVGNPHINALGTTGVHSNSELVLYPPICPSPSLDTYNRQAVALAAPEPPEWRILASPNGAPPENTSTHTPLSEFAQNTVSTSERNGTGVALGETWENFHTDTAQNPDRAGPERPLNLTAGGANEIQLLLENNFDIEAHDFGDVTALHWAARKGQAAVIEFLLQNGTKVDAPDEFGRTALTTAVVFGHESVLRLLLDRGANIESQDKNGETALSHAACLGREKLVVALLESGANPEAKSSTGRTALHALNLFGSLFGSEAIAQLLIEKGIDVNATDNEGRSALWEASREGDEGLVRLLLENRSDVNIQDNFGATALHGAALNGHTDIMELLIDNGADFNAKDECGTTPLHCAAILRNRAALRVLVNKGADLRVKDNDGTTVLHAAVVYDEEWVKETLEKILPGKDEDTMATVTWFIQQGHEAVVRNVLQQDSSELDSQCREGWTMLAIAAMRGYESVVRLALDYGADIQVSDKDGKTALHWAAMNGHHSVVKLLLENGVNVEGKDDQYDRTALHLAASSGHVDVVELLLENGADIQATGGIYGSALQAAIVKGHGDVVRLLVEHGADVNMRGGYFGCPLQAAAAKGYKAMVRLLLKHGSDVKTKGGCFGSALQAAQKGGHAALVKLLQDEKPRKAKKSDKKNKKRKSKEKTLYVRELNLSTVSEDGL